MVESAIVVEQLTRVFTVPDRSGSSWWKRIVGGVRPITAVDNVNVKVGSGQRIALLGQNGSGKSTLVKMLTGVIAPTSGAGRVLGETPWHRRRSYLRRIGVMFGQKSLLFLDLTVMDALRLYQILYEISEENFTRSLKELDEYLRFGRLLDRPVRKLSLGERMRCEVAAAILHKPDVLFLDEPTIGMDVDTRHGLLTYLDRHLTAQQTLILTTHELSAVRKLCDRLLVMSAGRVVTDMATSDLLTDSDRVRIQVQYRQVQDQILLEQTLDIARLVERRDGALVVDCSTVDEERVKQSLGHALSLTALSSQEAPMDSILESLISPIRPVAAAGNEGGA